MPITPPARWYGQVQTWEAQREALLLQELLHLQGGLGQHQDLTRPRCLVLRGRHLAATRQEDIAHLKHGQAIRLRGRFGLASPPATTEKRLFP
jgi:hypothetical protein